jgi:hypothetical protein
MSKDVNSKYTQMLNEMLSAENAAIDRIQSRLNTPLQEIKDKLQHHLQENTKQAR